MNVADIAKKIHREPAEIIKKLFMMGVMVNQNQALDKDTIELLAVDYGMEPQEKVQVDIADIDKFFEPEAVVEENLTTSPCCHNHGTRRPRENNIIRYIAPFSCDFR